MIRIFLISCLVAGLAGASHLPRNLHNGKVIGGQPTTIDKVPWQVALEKNDGTNFCGGSIISPNYILTATQCTRSLYPVYVKVRAGSSKLGDGGTVIGVDRIYNNVNFTSLNGDYDVAVLLLLRPLPLGDDIQVVPLRKAPVVGGEIALAAGWGSTNYTINEESEILQSVEIPIIDQNECNKLHSNEISPRMICAGETGKDVCGSDHGGALTIDNIQVGISAWNYGCALEGYPGVYTSVATVADFINFYSNNEATWV